MLFDPTIIRTKRKTYALIVQPDGSLVVRAPLRATQKQIEAILRAKESWIRLKQEQVQAEYKPAPRRGYAAGETFLFLGQEYPLEIVERQSAPLQFEGRFRLARAALPQAENVFTDWYKGQARQVFAPRVALYAQRHGFQYTQVRLSSARTRWGSCSSKGSLNFTWRLVMAPLEVIDYVVLHELVHTRIQNHSREFWSTVAALLPEYRERVAWLKRNGPALTLP